MSSVTIEKKTVARPLPYLLPMTPEEQEASVQHLVIERPKPADSLYVDKLMRMLVDCLYAWDTGGVPIWVMSRVGLFEYEKDPPFAPDLMFLLGRAPPESLDLKKDLAFYLWIVGEPPTLALEIVSDRRGGEDTHKLAEYARFGIPYYVIYDPRNRLKKGLLRVYQLVDGKYELLDRPWIEELDLGLTIWKGTYEDSRAQWLRWCDRDETVLPTRAERITHEQLRADRAKRRADKALQDAEKAQKSADREKQRADEALQREDEAQKLAESLRKQLRDLGIDPQV